METLGHAHSTSIHHQTSTRINQRLLPANTIDPFVHSTRHIWGWWPLGPRCLRPSGLLAQAIKVPISGSGADADTVSELHDALLVIVKKGANSNDAKGLLGQDAYILASFHVPCGVQRTCAMSASAMAHLISIRASRPIHSVCRLL